MSVLARRSGRHRPRARDAGGLRAPAAGSRAAFLAMSWNIYITVLPYGLLLFLCGPLVCGARGRCPRPRSSHVRRADPRRLRRAGAAPVAGAVGLGRRGVARWAPGARPAARRRGRRARGGRRRRRRRRRPAAGDEAARTHRIPPLPPSSCRSAGPRSGPRACCCGSRRSSSSSPTSQGNIGLDRRWFREPGDEARSLLEGWRVVADQYTLPPEWIAGQGPLSSWPSPPRCTRRVVPVLLVPVLVAVYVVRGGAAGGRRGRPRRRVAGGLGRRRGGHGPHGRTALRLPAALGMGPRHARRRAWCCGRSGPSAIDRGPAGRPAATCPPLAARGRPAAVHSSIDGPATADVPMPEMAGAGRRILATDVQSRIDEIPGDDPVLVRMGSFGAVGPGLGLVAELEGARGRRRRRQRGAGEDREHAGASRGP